MDFATRLVQLLEERKLSKNRFAEALGISNGLPSAWINTPKKPSYENLMAMADFFHVTTDYLMGRTDVRTPATEHNLAKRENRLLESFRQLDEDDQLIELGRVEALADSKRKKQRHKDVG